MSRKIRILIADDHPTFRYGLRKLLEVEPDLCVVDETSDASETVKIARRLKADIVLLDLAMRGASGWDVLRELACSARPIRTVLMAVSIEKRQILQALQLGARGLVFKESGTALFTKSIRTVMAGQYWLSREIVSDLVDIVRQTAIPEAPGKNIGLSLRELEVVKMIAAGSTNKEIAARFSISEYTVKHRLTSIFDKTGASNRLELALFALQQNFVDRV